MSGCASLRHPVTRVPVDRERLKQARYVEITYTNGQPAHISYLKRLPDTRPSRPHGLSCRPRGASHPTVRGAWIWHTQRLTDHPVAVRRLLEQARRLRLNRFYFFVSGKLSTYAPILRAVEARGIRVYATLGAPSDVDHWHRVDHSIAAVLAFNHHHVHGFAGLQFDIEPYVLRGFDGHRRAIYGRYVGLLRKIRIRIGTSLPWSVAIPFWFDQVRWGRGSLLTSVLHEADGITVMAYRAHYRAILTLARSGLCAGQRMGKPVELGVEVAPLPNERHYFLTRRRFSRDIRNQRGQVYFVAPGSPASQSVLHYEVRGSTLSYNLHFDAVARLMGRRPGYGSFRGWIIDGLEAGEHVIQND